MHLFGAHDAPYENYASKPSLPTSSLSFVKAVLFPRARAKLPEFVRKQAGDASLKALLADTCRESGIMCVCDISTTCYRQIAPVN